MMKDSQSIYDEKRCSAEQLRQLAMAAGISIITATQPKRPNESSLIARQERRGVCELVVVDYISSLSIK
jgi:hypothetical protein